SERRRLDAERHVLGVTSAGRVIVAADATNAAGDEMGVARLLAAHEHGITAKDGRRAVAFGYAAVRKIDLRINPEAAHDPRDRVPRHLDQFRRSCRLARHGSRFSFEAMKKRYAV